MINTETSYSISVSVSNNLITIEMASCMEDVRKLSLPV